MDVVVKEVTHLNEKRIREVSHLNGKRFRSERDVSLVVRSSSIPFKSLSAETSTAGLVAGIPLLSALRVSTTRLLRRSLFSHYSQRS